MRRFSHVIFVLLLLTAPLLGAQSVTISASNQSDGGAAAYGKICWAPTLPNGAPTTYHLPGGGQSGTSPQCATVTSGAFTLQAADTALTSPQNICFRVTLTTGRGQVMLDPCVQPTANNYWCTSGTCNFDAYIPSTAVLPTVAYMQTINGISGPWAFQGSGITCDQTTLICVVNGSGGGSVGDSDVTNQTASQSTANLVGTVPNAGKYRISYYASQHATCAAGTVSVTFTFSFNDGLNARTVQSIALTLGPAQSVSAGAIQGVIPIYALNASSITYTSTVTGACASGGPASYDAHISVEEVQ
jgi:hypothetical protein